MLRGYYTTGELAEIFHVSYKTIARWSDEGRFEYIRTFGGHRRFDKKYIDELVKQSKEKEENV